MREGFNGEVQDLEDRRCHLGSCRIESL